MNIQVKRVYDKPDPKDGFRILVDRLWPRGLSKENARIDLWLKSVAPSSELRNWYRHDPDKWPEFRQRYFAELDGNTEAVTELINRARNHDVVFLFGAREAQFNNAVALKEYLESRLLR